MSTLLGATRAVDFDGLYRHHASSVYRYARAVLGNHADAEDVTQQTFLNAYRAVAQGTKPRKAENWLLRIAHNEVRKHFRSAHQKRLEVELDEQLPDREPERSEPSLADVLRALQHLPPTQRSALVMREFEGRSYAEIAEIMDLTQSALEAQIFRARRALAEQLEGDLTCAQAEEALLRRLDSRLPRRVARRLKAHLGECSVCERFGEVQRRQRALLKGLSVMPVPASILLFRGEHAAAAGSAAVGGTAAAAAGAGGTGIAGGVVAKVAAVAAAATVAGGVGYDVAARPDTGVTPDGKVAAAQAPRVRPAADVSLTRVAGGRPASARAAVPRVLGNLKEKGSAGKRGTRTKTVGRSEKARGGVGHTHKKATAVDSGRPKARAGKRAAPRARSQGARSPRAVAKSVGRSMTPRPKLPRPTRVAEKPKPSPEVEHPAPPKPAEHPRPKGSSPVSGD
jgi:RNA polymerase sigma factor (sigma-70 family)